MNKDQVKGRVDETVGKVKKNVGIHTGNPRQADAGAGQELKGKVQKTVGDAKHKLGKIIDS